MSTLSQSKSQLVKSIEKKNPDAWLLIEVTQENENREPVRGRLVAKHKHRNPVIAQISKFSSPTYLSYTGKRDFSNITLLL